MNKKGDYSLKGGKKKKKKKAIIAYRKAKKDRN